MAIEIMDLPMKYKHLVIFNSLLYVYQRVDDNNDKHLAK